MDEEEKEDEPLELKKNLVSGLVKPKMKICRIIVRCVQKRSWVSVEVMGAGN